MSRKVTVKVTKAKGRKGRRRLRQAAEAPAPTRQPPERVPRVARLLALAHHWNGLIRDGTVRDRAELARLVGVSRARVTQVMRLLDLAPDIQEAVLDGKVDGPGAERALRAVAVQPVWLRQRIASTSSGLRLRYGRSVRSETGPASAHTSIP